jgi:hypothetical protein
MTANIQPIYTGVPRTDSAAAHNSGAVVGPSANTAEDGTGANVYLCFLAGSNAGSYVRNIRLVPVLSPAATKARFWICQADCTSFNPGTTNTATNMVPLMEVTLPAVTVNLTVQGPNPILAVAETLPLKYGICVTFETSTGSAGTGWAVLVTGGDY